MTRLDDIEDGAPVVLNLTPEEANFIRYLLGGKRDLTAAVLRNKLTDATIAAQQNVDPRTVTLPIIPNGYNDRAAWAERERFACKRLGIGFAAHGSLWHYWRAGDVMTFNVSKPHPELVQSFTYDGLDWLEEAVKRMNTR